MVQPVIPKRRTTAHVETLHGELCIYEWTTRTVHALNPAAARVWELCDGRATIADMAAGLRRELDVPDATAIVEHALTQFDRAGLLESGTFAGVGPRVSRRALLRRIGVAAAIPVVTSIVAPTPLAAQSGRTQTFNFTGGAQSFTVPAGITSLQVDAVGGSGSGMPTGPGGGGGRVQATLPVTALETLTIVVGGTSVHGGGFNGGGGGQGSAAGDFGGGGSSDISRGTTRLIVAGGGGGGGPFAAGPGGAGGGLVGGSGSGASTCAVGGGGGTQSAGGAGGSGGMGGADGAPGVSGSGGLGALNPPGRFGGSGGGGGYFGGGGGGACASATSGSAGGGGGSSFTDPSATAVVHTQGFGGNPYITISW